MRVLLSGYYGFGNLGDEAILATIAEQLPGVTPEAEVEVLSADPEHTLRVHGLQARDRWRLRPALRALADADLLVQGGGGLIQDSTSSLSPAYYLGVLALARWLRRPVVIFCQGVGPLAGALWRRLTVRAFASAVQVMVRDEDSAAALRRWGLRHAIEVVADPVVLMTPSPPEQVGQWLAEQGFHSSEPPSVLVPRALEGYWDLYLAAARVLAHGGQPLLVMPFQAGDEALAREMASRTEHATALPAPEDPRLAAGVVATSRRVIAARLHALVFAASAGVPALGLAYDPKVVRFCDLVGYEHADPRTTAGLATWAQASDDGSAGPSPAGVEDCRGQARRAFELLGDVIGALGS